MSETKELKKHSTEVWSLGCCFHRQFNALCYRAFGVWGGRLEHSLGSGRNQVHLRRYCVLCSEHCSEHAVNAATGLSVTCSDMWKDALSLSKRVNDSTTLSKPAVSQTASCQSKMTTGWCQA